MGLAGSEDLVAVRKVADEIKRLANKRYKLLELDLDGIFKRMLLLKKKKYAAVLVEQGPDGKLTERIEKKGLDIGEEFACSLIMELSGRACCSRGLGSNAPTMPGTPRSAPRLVPDGQGGGGARAC